MRPVVSKEGIWIFHSDILILSEAGFTSHCVIRLYPLLQKTYKLRPYICVDKFRKFTIYEGDRNSSYMWHQYLVILMEKNGRQRFSSKTALIEFTQFIYEEIDRNKCPVGLFSDLSRAFGTLDADFLINKIWTLGMRDPLAKWL